MGIKVKEIKVRTSGPREERMKMTLLAAAALLCVATGLQAGHRGEAAIARGGSGNRPSVSGRGQSMDRARAYRSSPRHGYYRSYSPYSEGYFHSPGYLWPDYQYPYGGYEGGDYSYSPRAPVYDPYYHQNMAAPVSGGGGAQGINVNRQQFRSNPGYQAHIEKLISQGYKINNWY